MDEFDDMYLYIYIHGGLADGQGNCIQCGNVDVMIKVVRYQVMGQVRVTMTMMSSSR